MKIQAIKAMTLNGKHVAAGETVDVKDKAEAEALVRAKLAKPVRQK